MEPCSAELLSDVWENYYIAIAKLQQIYQTISDACETRITSISNTENNYNITRDNFISSLPEEIAVVIKNPQLGATRSNGDRSVTYDTSSIDSNVTLELIFQNTLNQLEDMEINNQRMIFQIYDTYYNTIEGLPDLFDSSEKEISTLFTEAKHITKGHFEKCAEKEICNLRESGYISDDQIKTINKRILYNTDTFIMIKCSEIPNKSISSIYDISEFIM